MTGALLQQKTALCAILIVKSRKLNQWAIYIQAKELNQQQARELNQ
jgi:hypothetical protein